MLSKVTNVERTYEESDGKICIKVINDVEMRIVNTIIRESKLALGRHGFTISNYDVWSWKELESLTPRELEEAERFYLYLESIHAIYAQMISIWSCNGIIDRLLNFHVKNNFHKNYTVIDLRGTKKQ